MSSTKNNNLNGGDQTQNIEFTITETIEKLGIKEFILQDNDFVITWSNGRNSCISFNFKSLSLSQNIKLIEKTLKKEVKDIVDNETFDNAVRDIEDQLIKRREEIFNLNNTKTSENDSPDHEFKSKFLEDVSNLREQFENSSDSYKEWQQEVKKRHHKLHEI